MVSRALSTSDEVVVIAGAAPMLPTELEGNHKYRDVKKSFC